MYHPNKNIQIISIKDRVAKKVLRKIKYMYKNLPEYLQMPVANGRSNDIGTATEIEFVNGSTITSIPTTEDAGRSEGVSLLVIDEAAIIRYANRIWASAFPTLSTGGSAILNSTPYGVGNFFHQTWVDACSGGNKFVPIRLKWPMHPERDMDWYDMMRQSLGPRRTAQEIDGDFLASGDTVFDLTDIKAIEDNIPEYELLDTRFNGNLRVYEQPKTGFHYFMGADVATGRARDYSAFSIMDRYGDEKVCFKGKMPVEQFAKILMEYGRKYNNARLAPEANDIGLAVVKLIQEAGYPNLYYTLQILKEKGESKPKQEKIPGWYTTMKNRPVIIDELETDIRLDAVNIKDPFFVQEAYTFIYDDRNKAIAMGKESKRGSDDDMFDEQLYTDDAILAKAITNYVRKGKLYSAIVAPQ